MLSSFNITLPPLWKASKHRVHSGKSRDLLYNIGETDWAPEIMCGNYRNGMMEKDNTSILLCSPCLFPLCLTWPRSPGRLSGRLHLPQPTRCCSRQKFRHHSEKCSGKKSIFSTSEQSENLLPTCAACKELIIMVLPWLALLQKNSSLLQSEAAWSGYRRTCETSTWVGHSHILVMFILSSAVFALRENYDCHSEYHRQVNWSQQTQ